MKKNSTIFLFFAVASCISKPEKKQIQTVAADTIARKDTIVYGDTANPLYIHTGSIMPSEIVSYAKTLIGVPYVYASTDPAKGFDCSGFIKYVFNHFNIEVPRTSVNFTEVPTEIPVNEAKPADLILFTGTNNSIRTVGHMGIIIHHDKDSILFIHSTSGKANGVTITPLNEYYKGRFMKVIRVFPQNNLTSQLH